MKHILLTLFVMISVSVFGQAHRELSIDFNNLFSGNIPVTLGTSSHHHTDGAEVRFDMVNYYISNIRLVPTVGSEVVFDTVLLITGNNIGQPFTLGQLPEGTYTDIKFAVGLDTARNHGDPSTYLASHPLALQFPSMHWSWSSGYIFTKIEGMVDTSTAQTGLNAAFEYHIGSDAFYREVSVPITDLVVDANTHTIAASLDLMMGTVIGNLDLISGTDLATHTMDNMALANNIANSMQSAFVAEVSKTQLSGISDLQNSTLVDIYPNPLVASATLEVNDARSFNTIEVVDVTGKTIFTQTLDNGKAVLQRSQFPAAGIYMVKVAGESTAVRKLVVY